MTSRTEAGENELLFKADNGIRILTLNRPHRRNALTFAMYEQIKRICARAGTYFAQTELSASDAAFSQSLQAIAADILLNR